MSGSRKKTTIHSLKQPLFAILKLNITIQFLTELSEFAMSYDKIFSLNYSLVIFKIIV